MKPIIFLRDMALLIAVSALLLGLVVAWGVVTNDPSIVKGVWF